MNLKAAIDNPAYDFPDEASIFTSEARAIELTFEQIKMSKLTNFTIFSGSLSCLHIYTI